MYYHARVAVSCAARAMWACTGKPKSQGEVRLVGGREDPGGAWAYGRLEVFNSGAFSGVQDSQFNDNFGRRAAQVACRSLGFTSGAQILSGDLSALPGSSGEVDSVERIACQGDEATLADCQFPTRGDYGDDYAYEDGFATAVICVNASGVVLCSCHCGPQTIHSVHNVGT